MANFFFSTRGLEGVPSRKPFEPRSEKNRYVKIQISCVVFVKHNTT